MELKGNVFSKKLAALEMNRSMQWTHNALKLGKLKGFKLDDRWLITREEIERFKANPFRISREELDSLQAEKNNKAKQA